MIDIAIFTLGHFILPHPVQAKTTDMPAAIATD